MDKQNFLKRGFSILEVIVMTALLGLVGVIASRIFFTTLRSSTRSRISENLKQKGDFALNLVEKMVRGASLIEDLDTVCDGENRDNLSIVSRDGFTTTFECSEVNAQIASQSAQPTILLDNVTGIDCSRFINCDFGSGGSLGVTIDFTLTEGEPEALPHEKSEINFKTQVTLRNY